MKYKTVSGITTHQTITRRTAPLYFTTKLVFKAKYWRHKKYANAVLAVIIAPMAISQYVVTNGNTRTVPYPISML